jgi:polyhydroxybutyrate depolymerase
MSFRLGFPGIRASSCVGLLASALLASSGCGGGSSGGSGASGDGGTTGGACGTRSGMRGKTSRSVKVGSANRTYIVYLPQSGTPSKPVPLVYVFHGAGMNASEMFDITQYSAIADSDGIAVAYLDGQGVASVSGAGAGNPWNVSDNGAAVCGLGSFVNNPNANVDFEFMDAVKADVEEDQCLDAKHVFATGFSMGGYFSHHIGCDRADIRAVAPHSGATLASLSSCKTGHVPIIIFHGTADTLIAPGCDDPNSAAQSGFPPSATLWAQKNGCATTYTTVTEDSDAGGNGQCYVYDGCPADGQVELCTFTGMMHCYASGGAAAGGNFGCPTYDSATKLQWDFFKKYAW